MTRFRFNHLTYDVPPDVDIYVRRVEPCKACGSDHIYDFDFVKDAQIVSVYGGVNEDGTAAPTWADIGIEKIDVLPVGEPDEWDEEVTARLDTLDSTHWPELPT